MTVAELQYEHSNRLTAIETDASHCKAQHEQTREGIDKVNSKLDRLLWGLITILATVLTHLAIAFLKK